MYQLLARYKKVEVCTSMCVCMCAYMHVCVCRCTGVYRYMRVLEKELRVVHLDLQAIVSEL